MRNGFAATVIVATTEGIDMKSYEFTIVLAGVDVMTESLASALYGAGCSDGTPFSGEGIAAVGFDREAVSLETAIKPAVADVENAGLSVARVEIGSDELAALTD
jgi:hypothetical protein